MKQKSSSEIRSQVTALMSMALLFQDLCDSLERLEMDIKYLKSSNSFLTEELEASQKEIKNLRDRYSELLYKFSEIRNNS